MKWSLFFPPEIIEICQRVVALGVKFLSGYLFRDCCVSSN